MSDGIAHSGMGEQPSLAAFEGSARLEAMMFTLLIRQTRPITAFSVTTRLSGLKKTICQNLAAP
jgi:hypothetical protein